MLGTVIPMADVCGIRKNVKSAQLLFVHILKFVRIVTGSRQLQLLNEFHKDRESVFHFGNVSFKKAYSFLYVFEKVSLALFL